MTKEERYYILEEYAKQHPELGAESLLCGAAMDELNYVHLKCARNPELDYLAEFQKVIDTYTYKDIQLSDSVLRYRDALLRFGTPKWYNVGHYDLNDSVSYFGIYYDGTPTFLYRKERRYQINPICPQFLEKRVRLIIEIRSFVHSRWKLGEIHGIRHWDHVYKYGQRLLTEDVNPVVVGLFAYLHDSCREDDGMDIHHGERAAEWINTLRDSYLKDIPDKDIELLQTACKLHTTVQKTGNPTVDACFDSDRLDLWRVGIIPDPDRLATERGKEIARNTNYDKIPYVSYDI